MDSPNMTICNITETQEHQVTVTRKSRRYRYKADRRPLHATIAITGYDDIRKATGILEWAKDQFEAQKIQDQMKQDPHIHMVKIVDWRKQAFSHPNAVEA